MELSEVWCTYDVVRLEHRWAGLFLHWAGAEVPLPGFGASDCRCRAHLFRFHAPPKLAAFRRHVRFEMEPLFTGSRRAPASP
jgi:Uri superfamily endonuclease